MIKQLYHQYGKELFLYLYSMCQQKELAEDLLQETFLKAILALPEYHTNMRAWLYKVARNLFYNLYKRNRREICDEEYLKKISKLEVDEFLEEYISKQETRILYTAMQKLSPVKREVLELQYFGQMPLKEIANVLQLSQENVRVLSHRAKKDLKKIREQLMKRGVTFLAAAIGADKKAIQEIYQEAYLDISDIEKLPVMLSKQVMKYIRRY